MEPQRTRRRTLFFSCSHIIQSIVPIAEPWRIAQYEGSHWPSSLWKSKIPSPRTLQRKLSGAIIGAGNGFVAVALFDIHHLWQINASYQRPSSMVTPAGSVSKVANGLAGSNLKAFATIYQQKSVCVKNHTRLPLTSWLVGYPAYPWRFSFWLRPSLWLMVNDSLN